MNDQTPIAWTALTPEQKGDAIRPLITIDLLSYATIARRLGTTRSAIAAAADRHRIISPLTKGATGAIGSKGGTANKARTPRNSKVKPERLKMSRIAPTQPTAVPDDLVDKTPLKPGAWTALSGTTPRAVEHHKRDEHECCWPVGDDPILFCCAPAAPGRAYCSAHVALAYRPIDRTARKGTAS